MSRRGRAPSRPSMLRTPRPRQRTGLASTSAGGPPTSPPQGRTARPHPAARRAGRYRRRTAGRRAYLWAAHCQFAAPPLPRRHFNRTGERQWQHVKCSLSRLIGPEGCSVVVPAVSERRQRAQRLPLPLPWVEHLDCAVLRHAVRPASDDEEPVVWGDGGRTAGAAPVCEERRAQSMRAYW